MKKSVKKAMEFEKTPVKNNVKSIARKQAKQKKIANLKKFSTTDLVGEAYRRHETPILYTAITVSIIYIIFRFR